MNEEQKYKKVDHEEFCKRGIYTKKCVCGKEHELITQEDDNPEYHTDVHVKCDCGQYVTFDLPVN